MADAHRRDSSWQSPDLPLAARPGVLPGRLIELEPYRRRVAAMNRDARVNAEWDGLLIAVTEAWCWRDPDSLAAVEARIARVRAGVLEDWGYTLRKG